MGAGHQREHERFGPSVSAEANVDEGPHTSEVQRDRQLAEQPTAETLPVSNTVRAATETFRCWNRSPICSANRQCCSSKLSLGDRSAKAYLAAGEFTWWVQRPIARRIRRR